MKKSTYFVNLLVNCIVNIEGQIISTHWLEYFEEEKKIKYTMNAVTYPGNTYIKTYC